MATHRKTRKSSARSNSRQGPRKGGKAAGAKASAAHEPHKAKVGSDPRAVNEVGGKLDFGAPEDDRRQREYVSQETKQNDPGAAPRRIKTKGIRHSGAGAPESGPGSGSGGDVDTDIVGVGFGGSGVSQSGPDRTQGADITTRGGSEPFAAPGPKGHSDKNPRRKQRVRGSTVDRSGGDVSTTGEGGSAGSVTNPMARNDDSFEADINDEEARGGDNADSDRG